MEKTDSFKICNHSFRYVQARITATNQLRTEDIVINEIVLKHAYYKNQACLL
ncbi:unnamed protein product [Brassica oleracea var. botrytis]